MHHTHHRLFNNKCFNYIKNLHGKIKEKVTFWPYKPKD